MTAGRGQLDWSSISGSQTKFFDALCLLQVLHQSQRGDEISSTEPNVEDWSPSDFDDEDDVGIDDPNSEAGEELEESLNSTALSPEQLPGLRDRFLDRLSEVLARFKGYHGRNSGNLDANHVAAAYLEDHGEDSVEIFVAQNDGLDTEDATYLEEKLTPLLEAHANKRNSYYVSTTLILHAILEHALPRFNFYISILRNAFAGISTILSEPRPSYNWVRLGLFQQGHERPSPT